MIPSFHAELDNGPRFADLRLGWNEQGLLVWMRVSGKAKPLWCRDTRIEDSDGLHLWIDTRNTHNIHRASRFCHRFAFLPQGSGRMLEQPVGTAVDIHLAKEHPKPVVPGTIPVQSSRQSDGYTLKAFLPAEAITGFDPDDHRQIGFFYAVTDRELGWQTFSMSGEFPFTSDPSLWGTLELVREESANE
jgi:hypothetical protein